jgi:hypothetical protein
MMDGSAYCLRQITGRKEEEGFFIDLARNVYFAVFVK